MNDTLLGAIVGASAAIIGAIIAGVIAEFLKSMLEVRRENRNLLRIAFEDAKKLMFIAINNKNDLSKELIMETKIKMSIYATNESNDVFSRIIENIDNEEILEELLPKFNAIVKSELKIKK